MNKEQNSISNDKPVNNGFPNFSSFDMDLGTDKFCMAGGVPFEIPSLPSSPTDPVQDTATSIHTAGGVSFDIPPLPDFSSLDIPIEGLGLSDDSKLVPISLPLHSTEEKSDSSVILVSEPVQLKSSGLSTSVDDEFGGFTAFSTAPIESTKEKFTNELSEGTFTGHVSFSESTLHGAAVSNTLDTSSSKPSENADRTNVEQPGFKADEFGAFSTGFVATSMQEELTKATFLRSGENGEKLDESKYTSTTSKLEAVSTTVTSTVGNGGDLNIPGSTSETGSSLATLDDFGGFEAFSGPATTSEGVAQFETFAVSFPGTSSSSSNPLGGASQDDFSNFASFPATTHSGEASTVGDFGSFSSFGATVISVDSDSINTTEDVTKIISTNVKDVIITGSDPVVSEAKVSDGFFSGPSEPSTGDGIATSKTKDSEDEFGDFGSFSGPPVSVSSGAGAVASKDKDSEDDEFGDFGSFSALTATSTKGVDDNGFGVFASPTVSQSAESVNTTLTGDFGKFGGFSTSSNAASSNTTSESSEWFRKPSKKSEVRAEVVGGGDDDFGEFGAFSSTTEGSSGFSAVVPVPMSSEASKQIPEVSCGWYRTHVCVCVHSYVVSN